MDFKQFKPNLAKVFAGIPKRGVNRPSTPPARGIEPLDARGPTRSLLRTSLAVLVMGSLLAACGGSDTPTTLITPAIPVSSVATPKVTASVAGTHGFPFISSALNLAEFGYVEEEFLMGGTASAFVNTAALGKDGVWSAAPNADAKAPYQVRMLVRRPKDAAKFNGVVVVEWLNVSAGAEGTPDWTFMMPELLREGYAYVGVGVQNVGVSALKGWETGAAARYASLAHPGDSFSYDMYSQAGLAIRAPAAGDPQPLGPLTPAIKAVLADGESQSGFRMITYFNAVHPLAKVYDGFLIHSAGAGAALSQKAPAGAGTTAAAGVPATPDIAVPPTSALRTDTGTPVLVLNTETDLTLLGAAFSLHQQVDSASFRLWELAGAAHADQYLLDSQGPDAAKSGASFALNCGAPPINSMLHTYGARAALNALRQWVTAKTLPATAPRMTVAIAGASATIQRDPATGLAVGGIRLPQIAVPTATHTGERPKSALAANPFCALFGATDPWNNSSDSFDGMAGFDPLPGAEPVLTTLYPTHDNYVVKMNAAASDLVKKGFLRPQDALEVTGAASTSTVPN